MARIARSSESFNKKTSSSNLKKSGILKKKANEAGFTKRQALKGKAQQSTDVYEYLSEKNRRGKVKQDLGYDEAKEYGVDIDGDNDEDRQALRARLIGENDDGEEIDSDDDEEIDSDAAFEEIDEDRFAGFFSNKKKKSTSMRNPTVRFADVNLEEDEDMGDHQQAAGNEDSDEEEESGEDDEFIDLLDVLDGKGEIDIGSDSEGSQLSKAPTSLPQGTINIRKSTEETSGDSDVNEGELGHEDEEGEEAEEEGSSGSEIEQEEIVITASDDGEEAPNALDDLQNFVSGLDTSAKKRKASEDNLNRRNTKRQQIKEKTEAGAEDEFHAHLTGSKLKLDDLLAPLTSQSSALQSLKRATKILGPSSKIETLSAPLPQRAQERLDREAAYEQTKEEVDKWSGTMKRIREAEHLSFPLQGQRTSRVSNLELAAKFKPTTTLESSVDVLLKSAKMRDEDIQQTEEGILQSNHLSVEEVAQRRAELRKMRELMFRAEIKARRVSKIKSKTYRKLRRKEKERLADKINGDDEGDSDDEEARLKKETQRARERATLKHKHTGKWARQMRGKHGDEEGRKEIEEMLARGELLRKKIQGINSDDSEGDDDDDDDDDEDDDGGQSENGESGTMKIKSEAFNELKKLKEKVDTEPAEGGQKGRGIFEMKFMKDAMARQEAAANREVDGFMREMGGSIPDGIDDSDVDLDKDNAEHDPSSGVVVHRAGGRIAYRPGAPVKNQSSNRPVASLASDTSSVTLKSTDLLSPPPLSPLQPKRGATFVASPEVNPWLVPSGPDSTMKAPRKNEVVLSKESKTLEKSKNKLRKETKKREDEREKAKDDAVLEISMDNVLKVPSSSSPSETPKKYSQKKKEVGGSEDQDDNSDPGSETEAQERVLELKGKGKAVGPNAFQQRDLVALAFAGDNVVKEFEEAKSREIEEDAPREVDTTIPGWGTWGGAGTRKAPPKPARIKKIAGVDPTTRADYNKKHIIISEKRDKKASKYQVKDLPYPFTSKAQFERTMERPLGTEWNTRVAFQRATLPRVVKKPGAIISPLEKLT